jgi:hypothetical protein
MTVDQTNDKYLLDYRVEIEGMVAENRLRDIKGLSPAYGEQEFSHLSERYNGYLNRF